jgi:hypothetical protein
MVVCNVMAKTVLSVKRSSSEKPCSHTFILTLILSVPGGTRSSSHTQYEITLPYRDRGVVQVMVMVMVRRADKRA